MAKELIEFEVKLIGDKVGFGLGRTLALLGFNEQQCRNAMKTCMFCGLKKAGSNERMTWHWLGSNEQ